jgi:hypothetical protein
MTILKRNRSAVVAAAAGIEARARQARWAMARRLSLSLLVALLISAESHGSVSPARASNTPVGSASVHSPSGSRMISVTRMSARHPRSLLFRRSHHRGHDVFADGFFPFGFFTGWPAEPDLTVAPDEGVGVDWRRLPFWARLDRYEPPTVEKSPSGVTIIRGPGSHHGLVLP